MFLRKWLTTNRSPTTAKPPSQFDENSKGSPEWGSLGRGDKETALARRAISTTCLPRSCSSIHYLNASFNRTPFLRPSRNSVMAATSIDETFCRFLFPCCPDEWTAAKHTASFLVQVLVEVSLSAGVTSLTTAHRQYVVDDQLFGCLLACRLMCFVIGPVRVLAVATKKAAGCKRLHRGQCRSRGARQALRFLAIEVVIAIFGIVFIARWWSFLFSAADDEPSALTTFQRSVSGCILFSISYRNFSLECVFHGWCLLLRGVVGGSNRSARPTTGA